MTEWNTLAVPVTVMAGADIDVVLRQMRDLATRLDTPVSTSFNGFPFIVAPIGHNGEPIDGIRSRYREFCWAAVHNIRNEEGS